MRSSSHALPRISNLTPSSRYALGLLALAALHFGGAKLGLEVTVAGNASPLWLPAGLDAAAIAIFGYRYLPAVLIGDLLANGTTGTPDGVVLAQTLGSVIEAAVAAYLIRRLCGGPPMFTRVREVLALFLVAAPLSAAISASFGAGALVVGSVVAGGDFSSTWITWFLADAASIVFLVPAIAVVLGRMDRPPRRSLLEGAGLVAALAASAYLGLILSTGRSYFVFPALIWAALRYHQAGAALASLAFGATVVIAELTGTGPFLIADETEALALSQLFIALITLTAMVLAVIEAQRSSATAEREANRRLLNDIVDASPSFVFVKDLRGRYTVAGRQFLKRWPKVGSVLGKTDDDLFTPETAARLRTIDERVARTGETHDLHEQLKTRDGQRSYETFKFPLLDQAGEVNAVGGISTDVTERVEMEESIRRSEALLGRTERMAHVGGWVRDLRTDAITWSAESYRIHGVEPDAYEPGLARALVHAADRKIVDAAEADMLESGGQVAFSWRIVRPDGEVRVLRGQGEPERDDDGQFVRLVGFLQDVTELAEAEGKLRAAEARYRSLVERLPAVTYVSEAADPVRGRYVSPQIERLLGYSPADWLDQGLWRPCLHPEDRTRVLNAAAARAAAKAPSGRSTSVEYRLIAADGRTVWVRDESIVRIDPADGTALHDGMLIDITARKESESQLQFIADHDALTGLLNRRRLLEDLNLELKLVSRGQSASLVMLDLDNFKYVNDSLGHGAGDALIRAVAEILQGRLRESDTLARLGGDEFALLLRGARSEDASVVAKELLTAVREQARTTGEQPTRITASAGLTTLEDHETAEEALAAADLAMYEAKQAGRDRFSVYAPELQSQAKSRRSWADRLRSALEDDDLLLYQQPIVELKSGKVTQHELLLRMIGPDGRLSTPNTFLPIATRFDLMQAIDRWVARKAVALMSAELEAGRRVSLSVNLSGMSIGDPAWMDAIEAAFAASPVDPADLTIEVTETAAIANMAQAQGFSDRLSRLGCRFALDDFGSGFASFFYLKHLPVDLVKIDGDFIRGLSTSLVDRRVVTAMIDVAQALGQQTAAEFVGDEATLEILRDLGVDYAQGFHLGMPTPWAGTADSEPARPSPPVGHLAEP